MHLHLYGQTAIYQHLKLNAWAYASAFICAFAFTYVLHLHVQKVV